MEFLSLRRRRSSARNVPSGEKRGETDVFAGYWSLPVGATISRQKNWFWCLNLPVTLISGQKKRKIGWMINKWHLCCKTSQKCKLCKQRFFLKKHTNYAKNYAITIYQSLRCNVHINFFYWVQTIDAQILITTTATRTKDGDGLYNHSTPLTISLKQATPKPMFALSLLLVYFWNYSFWTNSPTHPPVNALIVSCLIIQFISIY